MTNTAEVVAFFVLSTVGLGSAIAMVSLRNVVHAALFLVLNFFSIAGLYLVLQSDFLAIVQIIIYAGAIMVVFLFVIMLLGVDRDDLLAGIKIPQRVLAWVVGGVLAVIIGATFAGAYTTISSRCGTQAPDTVAASAVPCVGFDAVEDPNVERIADRLFTRYTFPFELAGILLTVGIIGALVLGKRNDVLDDVGATAGDDDKRLILDSGGDA